MSLILHVINSIEYRSLARDLDALHDRDPANEEVAGLRTWLFHVGFRNHVLGIDLAGSGTPVLPTASVVIAARTDFDWEDGKIALFPDEEANLLRVRERIRSTTRQVDSGSPVGHPAAVTKWAV